MPASSGGEVSWLRAPLCGHLLNIRREVMRQLECFKLLKLNMSRSFNYQRPNFSQMCFQIFSKAPQDVSSVCSEMWSDFPFRSFQLQLISRFQQLELQNVTNYQLSASWRPSEEQSCAAKSRNWTQLLHIYKCAVKNWCRENIYTWLKAALIPTLQTLILTS